MPKTAVFAANSVNPVAPNADKSAIRDYLIQRGITAFQLQAGFVPPVTDSPLPITEPEFSEQTRSQRKTRHIRTMQWINRLNIAWFGIEKTFDSIEIGQVGFITYRQYLEFDKEE